MLPKTQRCIKLREQYALEIQAYERQKKKMDTKQGACIDGQQHILTMVISRLSPIHAETVPSRVQQHISELLHWLVAQKLCWMCGQRRRRSFENRQKARCLEAAIAQIDRVLPQLADLCSPDWNASSQRQGLAFQVFHRRDLTQCAATAIVREQWDSLARDQWYQEVALVRVKHPWRQLSDVFRTTNHIDQPWPRNREVVWSLDMHAYQQPSCAGAEPTGPHYPRSTSAGDVIVSLLTGAAWVIAPVGFLPLTPTDDENAATQ